MRRLWPLPDDSSSPSPVVTTETSPDIATHPMVRDRIAPPFLPTGDECCDDVPPACTGMEQVCWRVRSGSRYGNRPVSSRVSHGIIFQFIFWNSFDPSLRPGRCMHLALRVPFCKQETEHLKQEAPPDPSRRARPRPGWRWCRFAKHRLSTKAP